MEQVNKELLIEKIIQWNALEVCPSEDEKEVLIPYLMNDAVECYLKFEGCILQGEYDNEEECEVTFSFVKGESKEGLILRQAVGNVLTIWYEKFSFHLHCYQYHMIGHTWRKTPGEEEVRRLVNLICVIHDKVNYLGKEYCSDLEVEISKLAEFPPILYYTPINESILEWYPESFEGIEMVKALAKEMEDEKLLGDVEKYEMAFQKGKLKDRQVLQMASELLTRPHLKIWDLVEERIKMASEPLEARDYGEEMNEKISAMRNEIRKAERNEKVSSENILYIEEQPFTVMEDKNYKFRTFTWTYEDYVAEGKWKEGI